MRQKIEKVYLSQSADLQKWLYKTFSVVESPSLDKLAYCLVKGLEDCGVTLRNSDLRVGQIIKPELIPPVQQREHCDFFGLTGSFKNETFFAVFENVRFSNGKSLITNGNYILAIIFSGSPYASFYAF